MNIPKAAVAALLEVNVVAVESGNTIIEDGNEEFGDVEVV